MKVTLPLGKTTRGESLHERLTRQIAFIILSDESGGQGKMLPAEPDLCRHFSVSRTVLREAIKVLASKGLVELRPKIGMRVRPRTQWKMLDRDLLTWQCEVGPNPDFVRHLCETRLLLEPAVARMVAFRATNEEIEALERCYKQMESTVDSANDFIIADMEFHSTITNACPNDILRQMTSAIAGALRAMQVLVNKYLPDGRSSLPLHREIVDAIRQHNGPAAHGAAERLVMFSMSEVYQVIGDGHLANRLPEVSLEVNELIRKL